MQTASRVVFTRPKRVRTLNSPYSLFTYKAISSVYFFKA